MTEVTKVLAANAAAVLAVGTCAYAWRHSRRGRATRPAPWAFPRSSPKRKASPPPVINIPGCPPHPDWIVGTIGLGLQALATNTLGLLVKQGLDANGRLEGVLQERAHELSPPERIEAGHMVKTMSDKDGCRFSMGCKGPGGLRLLRAQMEQRGHNWCVNNATCIGCTSPTFPDWQSPFYVN